MGVREAALGRSDRAVVATELALHADTTRDPPHGRVVEQQNLHEGLHDVHEVVVAGDVRQLVGDESLDLLLTEAREDPSGEEHDRLEGPDNGGHGHLGAVDNLRPGTHPELGAVNLRQLLATWAAHDLANIAQIARVMACRYTSEVGPWAPYLSILSRS